MPLPYNPCLKQRARALRNRSTLTEILLWQNLKGRQRHGYRFHRQKPIDEYIVDFFSAELMLAIEIDGGSHRLKGAEDDFRQQRLESFGIRFLRFNDALVRTSLNQAIRAIDRWIEDYECRGQTHPGLRPPLSRGEPEIL